MLEDAISDTEYTCKGPSRRKKVLPIKFDRTFADFIMLMGGNT